VKFWASVTDAQGRAYEQFRTERACACDELHVIAPEARRAHLRTALGTRPVFVSWEAVHSRLKESLAEERFVGRTRFWVEELLEGVRQEAGMSAFRSFEASHCDALADAATSDALGNALHLVDALYRVLADADRFQPHEAPRTSHAQGLTYGFNLRWLSGSSGVWAWIGFWLSAWRAFGETPLWIELGPRSALGSVLAAEALRARVFGTFNGEDCVVVPLLLEPGVGPDGYAARVHGILARATEAGFGR
jgi:hypothetical protein